MIEYAAPALGDGETRRFVSCGLPRCNQAAAEWLAAREWAAAMNALEIELEAPEPSGNSGELGA